MIPRKEATIPPRNEAERQRIHDERGDNHTKVTGGGDAKSPFCFGKTIGGIVVKPEIKDAVLAIPNVNTIMVDGVESIVINKYGQTYDEVQEVLNKFDAKNVWGIPLYFYDDIWYCSGCYEYHAYEDTSPVLIQDDWSEQFCKKAVEVDECLQEAYIEYLKNKPKSCNLLGEEFLQKHGFIKMETHEVGVCGYEDGVTPAMALSKYAEHGENVIFHLDNQNLLSTKYSVWAEV